MKTDNVCPLCKGICDKRNKRPIKEVVTHVWRDGRRGPERAPDILQRWHDDCERKSREAYAALNKRLNKRMNKQFAKALAAANANLLGWRSLGDATGKLIARKLE